MGIKIKKDRTYTYEEIKDIFELAKEKTIREPLDKETKKKMIDKDERMKKELYHFEFMMGLESIILFDTLENNLFEKERLGAECHE